jgi:ATP-dependent Clp protease ATP-binding subunit ClpA
MAVFGPARRNNRHSLDGLLAVPNSNKTDVFAVNGWFRAELAEELAAKSLQRSVCWATDTRWDSIRTPHLFMGLLSTADRHVLEWCRMIGADADSLLLQFASLFTRKRNVAEAIVRLHREFLSENSIAVLRTAWRRAQKSNRPLIRVSDLLVALFAPAGGIVAGCFADVGLPPERLAAIAVAAEEGERQAEGR